MLVKITEITRRYPQYAVYRFTLIAQPDLYLVGFAAEQLWRGGDPRRWKIREEQNRGEKCGQRSRSMPLAAAGHDVELTKSFGCAPSLFYFSNSHS